MATACDPKGICPRCGYANGAGTTHCLRCHQVLAVPKGCSGHCTQCLIHAVLSPSGRENAEEQAPGRTKARR